MAKRRVRITAGFGSGGRANLIGSLLPSAQDQVEAKRVQRIKDNEKIAAFNNDQITYSELEAYFNDRLGRAIDETDKAEVSSMLTAAKAANTKKETVSSLNAISSALSDYQNGEGTYEDAKAVIDANRGKVTGAENIAKMDQAVRNLRTIKVTREVSAAVTDFNNGGSYDETKKTLSGILSSETNEALKTQIGNSLKSLRAIENQRAVSQANNAYEATGDINALVAKLDALRKAPDQTNPDEIQKIGAVIETQISNAQQSYDSKQYTAWQTHQMGDAEALQYFQGRLATAKNPKEVDYLGKYAANVQQTMDNELKQAQSRGSSVARSASTEANAQLARLDAQAKDVYLDYYNGKFKKDIEAAGSDPYAISKAYSDMHSMLVGPDGKGGIASLGGHQSLNYVIQAANIPGEAKSAISSALWKDAKVEMGKSVAELLGPKSADATITDWVKKATDVADRADEIVAGPYSNYFTDAQKDVAKKSKSEALAQAHAQFGVARGVGRMNEEMAKSQISTLFSSMSPEVRKKLAREAKLDENALNDLQSFSNWISEDVGGRAPQAALLVQDAGKAKDPVEANKIAQSLIKAFDGSKSGLEIGGDPVTTRAKVDWLNAAYPGGMMRAVGNNMTTDAVMADIDGSPERAAMLLRSVDNALAQPFRGAESVKGPDNPTPAIGLVLDGAGDVAKPKWNVTTPDQIAATIPVVWPEGSGRNSGKPIDPATKAALVLMITMGDNMANAVKLLSDSGGYFVGALAHLAQEGIDAGVAFRDKPWISPGSPVDTLMGIWQDTAGDAFDKIGTMYKAQADEAVKARDEFTKVRSGAGAALSEGLENLGETVGGEVNKFADTTGDQFSQWGEFTKQRADDWNVKGTESWQGITHNLGQVWNDTVSLMGGVQAAEPLTQVDDNVPTWGGWDSLTTDAQSSIQSLIDRANEPGWSFNEPGGAAGPDIQMVQPIAPTNISFDQGEDSLPFTLPESWNNPSTDWSSGLTEASQGTMLTE